MFILLFIVFYIFKYDELVKSQQKLVNMRLRHCILKTYRYYS